METWYLMEDGSVADPRHVVTDKKGLLRHQDGRAVAYADHGPRSKSINPEEEVASTAKKMEVVVKPKVDEPKLKAKDMKPEDEPSRGYKTRESKAR